MERILCHTKGSKHCPEENGGHMKSFKVGKLYHHFIFQTSQNVGMDFNGAKENAGKLDRNLFLLSKGSGRSRSRSSGEEDN